MVTDELPTEKGCKNPGVLEIYAKLFYDVIHPIDPLQFAVCRLCLVSICEEMALPNEMDFCQQQQQQHEQPVDLLPSVVDFTHGLDTDVKGKDNLGELLLKTRLIELPRPVQKLQSDYRLQSDLQKKQDELQEQKRCIKGFTGNPGDVLEIDDDELAAMSFGKLTELLEGHSKEEGMRMKEKRRKLLNHAYSKKRNAKIKRCMHDLRGLEKNNAELEKKNSTLQMEIGRLHVELDRFRLEVTRLTRERDVYKLQCDLMATSTPDASP